MFLPFAIYLMSLFSYKQDMEKMTTRQWHNMMTSWLLCFEQGWQGGNHLYHPCFPESHCLYTHLLRQDLRTTHRKSCIARDQNLVRLLNTRRGELFLPKQHMSVYKKRCGWATHRTWHMEGSIKAHSLQVRIQTCADKACVLPLLRDHLNPSWNHGEIFKER